jgi:hypothetical protein
MILCRNISRMLKVTCSCNTTLLPILSVCAVRTRYLISLTCARRRRDESPKGPNPFHDTYNNMLLSSYVKTGTGSGLEKCRHANDVLQSTKSLAKSQTGRPPAPDTSSHVAIKERTPSEYTTEHPQTTDLWKQLADSQCNGVPVYPQWARVWLTRAAKDSVTTPRVPASACLLHRSLTSYLLQMSALAMLLHNDWH